MFESDRFVKEEQYQQDCFREISSYCRPLAVQFCGNDPDILEQVVKLVAKHSTADAVDLNLGCPQDRAREGHFGSYLCTKKDRKLVSQIIQK
jgi:tRNA-dihydrouridine synthase 1